MIYGGHSSVVRLLRLQGTCTAEKLACALSASEVEGFARPVGVSVPQFPFLKSGKISTCLFEGA